jgi:hypothetical protein
MILSRRHVELLVVCSQYGVLTTGDFQQQLHIRSAGHMRKLLGELCGGVDGAARGYLFRVPLPRSRPGGIEHVYFLASRGRSYLARAEGVPVAWYRPPGKARQISYGHLIHNLTVARFLISLQVFCNTNTQHDLRLAEFRTQYEIARDPLLAETEKKAEDAKKDKNSTSQQTPQRVVPDAWVNVELLNSGSAPKSSPCLIEIDRGTTWKTVFCERIAARLSFTRGLYRRMFATDSVRILFVTTAGSARRDNLAKWTYDTLVAEERENWSGVFLFAEVSFETMYAQAHELFSDAVWVIPGRPHAVRLFG